MSQFIVLLLTIHLLNKRVFSSTVNSDWEKKIAFFLPAPKDLIPLNTTAGMQILLDPKTMTSAFFASMQHLTTQQSQSFCAIATSVTILNAISSGNAPVDPIYTPYAYWTQDAFFSDCTENIVTKTDISAKGTTLDQLQQMLKCYSQLLFDVTPVYADRSSVDAFRREVISGFGKSAGHFAINFHRTELGESGGGHWSPLMAYNEEADLGLLVDVARYKYPPMWVKLDELYDSMLTIDDTSTLYRGYIYMSPASIKTDLPVSRNTSQ